MPEDLKQYLETYITEFVMSNYVCPSDLAAAVIRLTQKKLACITLAPQG